MSLRRKHWALTGYDGRVPQLSASGGDALRRLAKRLGEWPLLLKLANGFLRERVGKYRQGVFDALRDIGDVSCYVAGGWEFTWLCLAC